MDLGIIEATLQTVARLVSDLKNNVTSFYTNRSLSDITKLTRVEPLAIVSKDCVNLEYMPDIMNSLLNIFSGHYLRAIDILTKVNNVEVIRILEKLNPDRDETGFLLEERDSRKTRALENWALENYAHSLPVPGVVALEDDNSKSLNESVNLSVGKQLSVDINFNKESAGTKEEKASSTRLLINVRLLASIIPTQSIEKILTYKTEDNSIVERFHSWRSGRIEFIRDLIFCQDLIDEYKRATINDDSNTLQEIVRRVNNAKKFGVLTKNPSLASAANIFVMSEEVARSVEAKLGGKLSSAKTREKAFDNTYAMIIAVVDREWERVTFYTRGISQSTEVSIKEIKASNKGKGPDIGDILKMLNMGNAPSF